MTKVSKVTGLVLIEMRIDLGHRTTDLEEIIKIALADRTGLCYA